jgi:hypothetical protein
MSQEDNPGNVPVTFIDNPHAPEVFSTDCAGFLVQNGNVHLTFESARVNHERTPGPVNRVVIARLVLPVPAAQRLAAGLYDFLKNQGFDPVPVPDVSQLQ